MGGGGRVDLRPPRPRGSLATLGMTASRPHDNPYNRPRMPRVPVSAIVTTFNEIDFVEDCLRSVEWAY